jgi:hypothetical protein
MGSGISLTNEQLVHIIKRDVTIKFYEDENMKDVTTVDGYLIYYDFAEEVKYTKKLKELDLYVKNNKK